MESENQSSSSSEEDLIAAKKLHQRLIGKQNYIRHHQRRCTGRKVAPSSLVIRGSVQLASAVATKFRSFTAEDLSQVSFSDLSDLRDDLKKHHDTGIEQFQFRRNPSEYLASLESMLL